MNGWTVMVRWYQGPNHVKVNCIKKLRNLIFFTIDFYLIDQYKVNCEKYYQYILQFTFT